MPLVELFRLRDVPLEDLPPRLRPLLPLGDCQVSRLVLVQVPSLGWSPELLRSSLPYLGYAPTLSVDTVSHPNIGSLLYPGQPEHR